MCRIHTNIKFGERWNTLKGFIRPALGRRNLDMVTDAHVSKVSISDRQVPDKKRRNSCHSVLYASCLKFFLLSNILKVLCYRWCKTKGNLSSELVCSSEKKNIQSFCSSSFSSFVRTTSILSLKLHLN